MPAGIRNKFLFIVAGFSLISLLSLSLFPLPWFDEAYLNSVVVSFIRNQNFTPLIADYARSGKEALSYGPVYFVLQAGIIQLFGNTPFAFRFVGFCAALVILLLLFWFGKDRKIIIPVLLMFAIDPFLNLCMREGRPDILATAFALSGWVFFLKEKKHAVLGSLFLTLAFLTHPRSIVLIIPVYLFLLIKKDFRSVLVCLLLFTLAYTSWLYYAFGSLENWYLYFNRAVEGNATARSGFLGPNTYWPKILIPLYALTAASFIYKTLKFPSLLPKNLLYFTPIILFHLFLRDFGTYSIVILPFLYTLLIKNLDSFSFYIKNGLLAGFILLFSFFFMLKTGLYFSVREANNLRNFKEFISENIPDKAKVTGDALFYYALLPEGYHFQLYNKYLEHHEREMILRRQFAYEYLLIPEKEEQSELLHLYADHSELKEIARFHKEIPKFAKQIASFNLVSTKDINGYNCILYKRTLNE